MTLAAAPVVQQSDCLPTDGFALHSGAAAFNFDITFE